ncbi:ATP-binding cassette domain-containing protein, partial [Campylobacter coli]
FHKGKITSIIGANGAGKSTLLALASRLIKPDSGRIYIDGMNLFKSLLFLGAGNVMHAMDDQLDIKKMGGLFKSLKITAIFMTIG